MSTIKLPKLIFGTSGLGNLYVATPFEEKLKVVSECIKHSAKPVVFDSAGKYGAGLALETLGLCLKELDVSPDDVIISNKLGWYRTELKTTEPTFEPGVWKDLDHDAVQKISYDGILECYEQGNQLLNGYRAKMVSVHDPDEYLIAAGDSGTEDRYADVLEAYRALAELKKAGSVTSVGVGAKNWRVIQRIADHVDLDWVMIANSMTVHDHPKELALFMRQIAQRGVKIINSAVFNGGFLIGADHYNYQPVSKAAHPKLYQWRERFYALCGRYGLKPAAVCVNFGLNAPGVASVAMNTTNPARVADNVALTKMHIPDAFWSDMITAGLMKEMLS